MAIHVQPLAVSVPGLRAVRWTTDALFASMKDSYVIARLERGSVEWVSGTRRWVTTPGMLQLKQPGDVHRDVSQTGPVTFQIVTLPAHTVEERIHPARIAPQLAANDERATVFHRLHDAIAEAADRLELDVALTEAIAALANITCNRAQHSRAVRRAIEHVRARIEDSVTLDELAAHAGIDKFELCRAFRAELGMPPYAYLTQLRIVRAKALLRAGMRASDVAPRVGLYDQSQLNRHFRRIVGMTPARWAAAHR